MRVPAALAAPEIEQRAMARDKIQAQLADQQVVRVVHVPGRLINIVTRPK